MTDLPMIDEIYVLKHSKSSYFSCCPCKKSGRFLCVISNHHELVVEVRKERFNSFSEILVCPFRSSPILLIQPIWYFQSDVCHIEKILLYLSTEITFVAKHHTIVVLPLHIIEILEIVDVRGCHIVGMNNATYSTDCVEFIAVIGNALRCAVNPLRSAFIIISNHSVTFGSGILVHFDRLEVYTKHIFIAVHCHGDVFAYLLAKNSGELAASIVLAPGNKIGHSFAFFRMKACEKIIHDLAYYK